MKCNLSKTDRWVRVGLGAALLGVGIVYGFWWGYLFGIALLVNAAMGVCGLYRVFGISTYKGK